MSWVAPYPNADFTKLLIRQLLSIIQRDQRAALDWAGGQANLLPSILSYQLAPLTRPLFPAVAVYPLTVVFDEAAWRAAKSTIDLFVGVWVSNADNQVLIEQVQDYVRALDAIVNALVVRDFTDLYTSRALALELQGAVTAPALATGTVQEMFVVSHEYNEIHPLMEQFGVSASLRLRVFRTET